MSVYDLNRLDLSNIPMNPISLEFEKCLTTGEWMCRITKKINDCVDFINNVIETENTYTDKKIAELRTIVNGQLTEMTDYVNNALTKSNNYTDSVRSAIMTQIDDNISNIRKELISSINDKNTVTNDKIDKYYREIQRALQEGNKKITCPCDGNIENIQVVINHLYDMLRNNAITAEEFDALGLTAEYIDSLSLSAAQFDNNSKNLLV